MERGILLWVVALNVLAGGVLYSRFSSTDVGSKINVQIQTLLSSIFPEKNATCGLLHWSHYTIVSNRVVLSEGVKPAAGATNKALYDQFCWLD